MPFLPDGDEVIIWLCLQQGEVEVDAISSRHRKKPRAVLGTGILIGKAWRVDSAIVCSDVSSTRNCMLIDRKEKKKSSKFLHRSGLDETTARGPSNSTIL